MSAMTDNPAPGTRIDGFVIEQLLSAGGMGRVYAVRREDGPAGERLVMKRPRMDYGAHPACYICFETEQMILSALEGSHVPRLVAKGDLATCPYMVMEWIEGPALTRAAVRAPLPADEVARLLASAASAVHAIHRQNVVHLDLKPANISMREDGTVVLLDFGLAHHADLPDLVEDEFDVPLGTGAYISPEQLAGIRSDPRSDIYALGVIGYRLATGRKPFGEPVSLRAMRGRLFAEPVPPRALRPGVPDWLQEIILRCLEVNADARYATAAQLAHDLSYPDQVPLTERAARLRGPAVMDVLRRRLHASLRPASAVRKTAKPREMLARAPHLLVAVDTEHADAALAEAMRDTVRRAVIAEPHVRVTLIAISRSELFGEDAAAEIANAQQVQDLVALRHWIAPLDLPQERLRVHVETGVDPAQSIIQYARRHHTDRIIVGARGASPMRRHLGSVSSRVVAESPCSVSVVRPRRNIADD